MNHVMNDAQLATSAATGDRQALAAIYDRYADRIHDFCRSILRDADEAADVTSETFVRAAEHLGNLREPAKLKSWLFAVARHEALARIRARKRAVPTEELADTPSPEAEDEMTAPERVHDEGELREIVWEAATGLNERDRVVLDLNLRQGLVGRDLAEAIGVSENAANVRLHRMKERFERAVGAFLVARQGARDCQDLDGLLAGWDGTFSPRIRKRVARHVERCDVCGEQQRSLTSPLALLAGVPALPAPDELRERVLDRVQHVSHVAPLSGRARLLEGWTRAGFPPPLFARRRRRSLAAALLAILLLVGLGVFVGVTGGGDTTDDETRLAGRDRFAATATTSTSTSTTSTTTTTTTSAPATAPPTDPATGSGSETTGSTTTTTSTSTDSTESTTTTTTEPPDETGPEIGTIAADPSEVRENGGEFCPDNHTSTVSVSVDDPSGVSSVTLSWSVGNDSGSKPMSHASGSTYQASVGDWPPETVDGDTPVSLTVAATDGDGNTSSTSSSSALTLIDCY